MPPITTDAQRAIIENFAKLIKEKATKGSKPEKSVINFREEKRNGTERDIFQVPVNLLRYRKENGRIASDVLNYEKSNGILHEQDEKAQELLGKFLEEKDAEKTDDLMKSIEHTGQNEPASRSKLAEAQGELRDALQRGAALKQGDISRSRHLTTISVITGLFDTTRKFSPSMVHTPPLK